MPFSVENCGLRAQRKKTRYLHLSNPDFPKPDPRAHYKLLLENNVLRFQRVVPGCPCYPCFGKCGR